MQIPTHDQKDPPDPDNAPSPTPSSSSSPHSPTLPLSSHSPASNARHTRPTYSSPAHRAVASYLNTAIATRILGNSPAEHDESELTPLRRFIASFPTHLIIFQLIWSAIVSALAFALVRGEDNPWSTLSSQFWPSQLLLTPSVVSGVGWALFVLLGFFIREAAQRYDEALRHWGNIATLLRQTIRQVVQAYPPGVWHDRDHDRLVAHLVAYPLALKMTLRGERDRGPLEKVLHSNDVDDVIAADSIHVQCIRVVRAYLSSAEVDSSKPFFPQKREKEKGFCPRYFAIDQIDAVEIEGNALERISRFQPAVGYTFHLKVFLYIWMLFLPLGIIETSGWFTPLWSGLITYGVGMLFQIAMHLNEPFGFDLEDIKLNRIAAETALGALDAFATTKMTVADVVRASPQRSWIKLSSKVSASASSSESGDGSNNWRKGKAKSTRKPIPVIGWAVNFFMKSRFKADVAFPMTVFAIWLTVVVFLTWGLAEFVVTTDAAQCVNARWWCLYIPLNPRTTRYIGLGVFLLLGFWINDAYGRYKRGLFLWKVDLQRSLEQVALLFCMVFKRNSWHEQDRERLLSHIAALPYTCKLKLRDTRDLAELTDILSEEDLQALGRATSLPEHCLSVINGYMSASDTLHHVFKPNKNPLYASRSGVNYVLHRFEMAFEECEAMRKFPIPHAFTFHLQIFSGVWLFSLPIAFVGHYGFLALPFLLPVGYSIINLLSMGLELADPFGTDWYDIPLDDICEEIKYSIRNIYEQTGDGPGKFVKDAHYNRESFEPMFWNHDPSVLVKDDTPTLRRSIKKLLDAVPSVNVWAQVFIILWSVVIVFASYGFSKIWDEEKRGQCRAWCSPIDVDGSVLLEIGFGLFLILSFRASDALSRYEHGAEVLSQMQGHMRNLSLEVLKHFDDGTWHHGDKERIVAHLAQLPLALRDKLLGIRREEPQEKDGILVAQDRLALESAADPVKHCLDVVHSYIVLQDCKDYDYRNMATTTTAKFTISNAMQKRCLFLRKLVAETLLIKQYPVAKSYTRHQRFFTALWLALLPLSMTATSGFITIGLAPLISYGILGLEAIANELMDPFGYDATDLPLEAICTKAASAVIEAALSVKWGCYHHVIPAAPDSASRSGLIVRGQNILDKYSLPKLTHSNVDADSFGRVPLPEYRYPRKEKVQPSLYAHFIHSVPWWILLGVAVWTSTALIISYLAKEGVDEAQKRTVRWWLSSIRVDSLVGTYVSFAAFLLLSFYVKAAFNRYNEAGVAWGDDLRAACHSFATQIMLFAPQGAWHPGDHERILAHVAAIPITLKQELRHERNLIELKGLLSQQDIGRIHIAGNMAMHCLDVLRSYCAMAMSHNEKLHVEFQFANRAVPILGDVRKLEGVVRNCLFIRDQGIARGFTVLLRALLVIFFLLVPFVLAEDTGWITVLWVTIIGYAVTGMYQVANELQQPFGTDLNDLDLDELAARIVEDVIFVHTNYASRIDSFVVPVAHSGAMWDEKRANPQTVIPDEEASESEQSCNLGHDLAKTGLKVGRWAWVRLLTGAVGWWMLPVVGIFSVVLVGVAYGVSRASEFECDGSFCTKIAISGEVKEYVGFALFLLLGFRLYDSHWRYVTALRTWRDGILTTTGLLANRLFEAYGRGMFHEGDLERMAAHLVGFVVVTAKRLRREARGLDCAAEKGWMGEEDISRVERAMEKGDYCLDVVRGYLVLGDMYYKEQTERFTASDNEALAVFLYVQQLRDQAAVCERMIKVPLPYGYVQHVRIFLVIWLAMLPLGIVEAQGWWSVVWTVIIAYGLIGIERWSGELADPFGVDLSDIPLGELSDEAFRIVKANYRLFRDGTVSVIKTDREPFQDAVERKQVRVGENGELPLRVE